MILNSLFYTFIGLGPKCVFSAGLGCPFKKKKTNEKIGGWTDLIRNRESDT